MFVTGNIHFIRKVVLPYLLYECQSRSHLPTGAIHVLLVVMRTNIVYFTVQ